MPGKSGIAWTELCPLISGLLLGCSFPPIDCAPVAWVALTPLCVVLVARRIDAQVWAGVFLGGLAFHLLSLSWIRTLYGAEDMLSPYAKGWVFISFAGAVVYTLGVLIGRLLVLRTTAPLGVSLPIVWIAYEWLRSGVATLVDPALAPWLRLGSTQAEWPAFAQAADLGGEALLGALVAAGNGALFDVISLARARIRGSAPPRNRLLILAPAVLVLLLGYGHWRLERLERSEGPTVALMHREAWLPIPASDASPSVEATRQSKADLLIWPELGYQQKLITGGANDLMDRLPADVMRFSGPNPSDYKLWVRQRLAEAASGVGSAVLLGMERIDVAAEGVYRYNSVVYACPHRGFVGWSDKRQLAPITERGAPRLEWLAVPRRALYEAGHTAPLFDIATGRRSHRFACLVCYDIASPYGARRQSERGAADFFVHCGSEGADATGCLSKTLLRMARLRAIENRRAVVRNCHLGSSGVVDPTGRFTACDTLEQDIAWTPMLTVPVCRSASLFATWGELPLAIASVLAVLVGMLPGPMAARSRRQIRKGSVTPVVLRWKIAPNAGHARAGFSLLELLAVVAILGILAFLTLPRVGEYSTTAEQQADAMNRGQINAAVERYYMVEGNWPADDLSDIGADLDYFPHGLPTNPTDGSAYQLNSTTHRVIVGGGGK